MTVDFSTCLLTKCYTYSLVCVKCLPTMYGGVLYFLWSHLNLALVRYVCVSCKLRAVRYLLFGVLRLFAASIFEVNQCRNLFSPQNRIYMYIFYPCPEILTHWRPVQKNKFSSFCSGVRDWTWNKVCLIFSRAFVQYNRFYPCSSRASHVFVTHTTRGTTLPRRLTGLYFQHFSRTLWTLDLGPYVHRFIFPMKK